MIDEKLLLKFIRTKKEEFEEEGFTNYKKHTNTLKNMESMEAITATVDIYVLMNLIRILNELIEIIESGKFDVVENQILITELNNIKKLLNDLYEGIDEYYTETLERNDELAVARADAELKLIKEIIDRVEEI